MLHFRKLDKSSFSPPTIKKLSKTEQEVTSSLAKYLPGITMFPPSVWLYSAVSGGVLFVHLTVTEPYFSVAIHMWSRGRLACECGPTEEVQTEVVQELRELEQRKDELVQKCHVHSFTYDFHLRMVSRYLVGGKEVSWV